MSSSAGIPLDLTWLVLCSINPIALQFSSLWFELLDCKLSLSFNYNDQCERTQSLWQAPLCATNLFFFNFRVPKQFRNRHTHMHTHTHTGCLLANCATGQLSGRSNMICMWTFATPYYMLWSVCHCDCLRVCVCVCVFMLTSRIEGSFIHVSVWDNDISKSDNHLSVSVCVLV